MKKRLGIRIAALVFALVFAILPVGAAAARPTPTPEPTPVPRVTISTAAEFADFARRMAIHRKRLIAAGVNCAPLE